MLSYIPHEINTIVKSRRKERKNTNLYLIYLFATANRWALVNKTTVLRIKKSCSGNITLKK